MDFSSLGLNPAILAAVAEQGTAADIEFVALGMATEVIVIIENKDACAWISFAIKVGGRKTADSSSRDDEIIVA